MSKSLQEIEKDVMELPEKEKEVLAHRIFSNLEIVNPDIEKAWADEADLRLQELIDGKVKGIPVEEAFADVRRALDEQRNITSSSTE